MALPTITNNSPAAGSIAWTAFGIQYNGQSFSIPAGNTASKFVWWLYNGGTAPALQSGNALPTLGPDDMILFLNKSGIGALVPTSELYDGSLIVGGSVIAQAIATDAIQTEHISANAVTSDEIAANAIIAKHVAAGTMTADKLSVGTVSDNMVVNGSFEDNLAGYLVGWEANAMTNGTIQAVTGQSSSGAVSMQFMATTTAANLRLRQLPAQYIPVSAASGRKYYISTRAGATVATTTGHYMRVNWYDGSKVFISSTDVRANAALTTTFTLYEGQVTPPATAKYMGMEILVTGLNVVTTVYIDEVSAHEVTMSAQIGDGQITAAKILANTITGDRIAASTIAADKLLVSDRTNYWENPDFEGDTVGGIPKGTTLTVTTNARVLGAGSQGSGKCLEINALNGSNNDVYSTNIFPVEPGDQFYVTYDFKFLNTVGTNGSGGVGFRGYGPTKVALNQWWSVSTGTAKPTAWQELGNAPAGIYTVPAGTYFLQPYVSFTNNLETTNRLHVDNIIIRRMNGGELIIDGAIYAAKIAANAVTSEKIAANAVTANAIAANAIVAESISANALNGKVITGSTVQTAATGARVVMDSTGLRAWDATDKQYLTADSTGLTVDGTLSALGKGYSSGNNQIDMNLTVGARGQHRRTIATQQWPPPPAPTAQTIPGITFKPVVGTMYNYAGMYSENGYALGMSSGTGDLSPAGTDPTTLLLHTNAIYANKVVDAPAYTVNGLNMASASVVVMDFANVTANHATTTTVGAGTVNAGLSTDTSWGTPGYQKPGTIYLSGTGSTIYDIDANLTLDGAGSTRAFIDVEHLDSAGVYIANLGRFTFTGDDTVHGSLSSVMLSAGSYIRLRVYQQSGVSRNTTSARLRVKKVVGPAPSASWAPGDQTFSGNVVVNNTLSVNNMNVSGDFAIKHRRAEFNCGYFDVAANAVWDIGPQTLSTASPGTLNNDFVKQGPYAGSVEFTKSGYYQCMAFVIPNGNPGGAWLRAQRSGDGRYLGQVSNGAAWESTLTLVPFYFAAGEYIRFAYSASIAHSIRSWVTVTQAY